MSAYEALVVGQTVEFGMYEFTAERIKAWAVKWDPQPFHVDEAAAKKSVYGGLITSGWHTCAILMRLQVEYFRSLAALNPGLRFGPSPGFEDLKWLKPIYAGDRVTYSATLADKRLSQSRPGMAIITSAASAVNQKSETVMTVTGHVFVWVGV